MDSNTILEKAADCRAEHDRIWDITIAVEKELKKDIPNMDWVHAVNKQSEIDTEILTGRVEALQRENDKED